MDLREFHDHGQSIWIDYIRRELLETGEFERLVQVDDIRGVTTNPSIFEKAIGESTDYDVALRRDLKAKDEPAGAIYERLVIEDIQRAADVLRPTFDASGGNDGFVSMEVSPYLAHDTAGTIAEARRLWTRIGRPNVMIKVPGTVEGVPAIEQLTAEGLNVNITLLFGRDACRRVQEAYMAGLETRIARSQPIDRIASVASMFVSRIDVLVGKLIDDRLAKANEGDRALLQSLRGKVGIANAKLAYQDWKEAQHGARWKAVAAHGARPQRMLWASTSTKDKRLSDVLYVEALLGPDTIDTVPPATLAAMRDHGHADEHLEEGLDDARDVMDRLARAGISLDDVTRQLVEEGVAKFSASFDELMASVERKRDRVLRCALDRMSYALPAAMQDDLEATLEDWRTAGKVRRLWEGDATLWTGRDEGSWVEWLGLAGRERVATSELEAFARQVHELGFTHAVVLGMGGSSLCPEVLARTFGARAGYPELIVLDSTDPAQIATVEARVALATTLFIVSSKSGTTLEPNLLLDYFHARVGEVVGEAAAGGHFVAITDPGTALQKRAESLGFLHVFAGRTGVGGRYSALSNFGMVPAALLGLDVKAFLDRAEIMARSCAPSVPPNENAGVLLGAILGTAAKAGHDKVTLIASPDIAHLGPWIEQLLAESTGKQGRGLVPIDHEPLGPPSVYGDDRLFVYLRLDHGYDPAQDAALAALEKAGQPIVHVAVAEPFDLGQEFFRWEIAAAVAGSILGINPFDQPDVEASKQAARAQLDEFERAGAMATEAPLCRDGALELFAPERDRGLRDHVAGRGATLHDYLHAHLDRIAPGDFVALLAFLPRDATTEDSLQGIRIRIRDARRVATSVGFGPRFLHSTGQLHKGGPNTGVYLQLTCDDAVDVPVPDRGVTFGVVKAAQARGDMHV
ncbi:MAG TPA: bifunctional transaldolase/phosoglucose isomerase, partial [Kofleriaceae bacterium]|nr:bifunctional transaldolase/phosoglucose isomerase [Kofleriaceae bacterium]